MPMHVLPRPTAPSRLVAMFVAPWLMCMLLLGCRDPGGAQEAPDAVCPSRPGTRAGNEGSPPQLFRIGVAGALTFDRGSGKWVRSAEKWGCIDSEGRVVIPPSFEYLRLVAVLPSLAAKANGKWGVIDSRGTWVIEARYDDVFSFGEGAAAVRIGERFVLVDREGAVLAETDLAPMLFAEGLAAVDSGGRWGFIDRAGQFVIPPRFKAMKMEVPYFHGGLARMLVPDGFVRVKCGWINRKGEWAIPPRFACGGDCSEGIVGVLTEVDGKMGFVDRRGRMIIKPQFDGTGRFSEGLCLVEVAGKIGYIDTRGNLVVSLRWEDGGPFSEGLAEVSSGGKWGFVDNSGKIAIPARFDDVRAFSHGRAAVRLGDTWGFIDRDGRSVGASFDAVANFFAPRAGGEPLAEVWRNHRMGYLGRNGGLVWVEPGWVTRARSGSR